MKTGEAGNPWRKFRSDLVLTCFIKVTVLSIEYRLQRKPWMLIPRDFLIVSGETWWTILCIHKELWLEWYHVCSQNSNIPPWSIPRTLNHLWRNPFFLGNFGIITWGKFQGSVHEIDRNCLILGCLIVRHSSKWFFLADMQWSEMWDLNSRWSQLQTPASPGLPVETVSSCKCLSWWF